jgi:hypothetical protein
MTELVRKAVDTFGRLTAVHAGSDAPGEGPASPIRFEEYTFTFEHGSITATAEGETDSLTVGENSGTWLDVADLSGRPPWSDAIGCGILWLWLLENQNGYVDGVQIEFADGAGKNVTVQLMCWASALSASRIVEFTDRP